MNERRKRLYYFLNLGTLAINLTVVEDFQPKMVPIERIFSKQNYAHWLLIYMPPPKPLSLKHGNVIFINISEKLNLQSLVIPTPLFVLIL